MNAVDDKKLLQYLKILSNEDRFGIVKLLSSETELCAKDIGKRFYLEQSTTSHHLNLMREAGFVHIRKKGRNNFYSLNQDIVLQVIKLLKKSF